MKMKVFCVTSCVLSVLVGGCARQISPNVYSEASIGETSQTYRGVIVSMRDVMVEGKEKLDQNTTGMALGGVGGAVVGNQFGAGGGNLAATAAGAIAGAVAGSLIQKELEKQNAVEYTVQLQDGSLKTLVQGPEPRYQVGQKVLLISYDSNGSNYRRGRSRIIADHSAA